jgi:hypothetical protein
MACSLLFITQLALVATVVVFDIQQNSVTVMQSTKDPCCCEDDESSKLQKQNVQEHEFALLLAHKELVKERKLQEQVEERKLPRRGLGGAAARVHVISDSDDDVCVISDEEDWKQQRLPPWALMRRAVSSILVKESCPNKLLKISSGYLH